MPEVLFGKLAYGKWDEWTKREHRAVNDFLHAFWQSVITVDLVDEFDDCIDTALCALGNACTSTKPFLEAWRNSNEIAAARQLAQWIVLNIEKLGKTRLSNSFWRGREAQEKEVIDWLREPATHDFLDKKRSEFDARLVQAVDIAVDILKTF
jgi:hypothetical protein